MVLIQNGSTRIREGELAPGRGRTPCSVVGRRLCSPDEAKRNPGTTPGEAAHAIVIALVTAVHPRIPLRFIQATIAMPARCLLSGLVRLRRGDTPNVACLPTRIRVEPTK